MLRIRFANQPDALAVLALVDSGVEMTHDPSANRKANGQQAQKGSEMTLGSGEEMTLGSGVEMTPEPLTEPLTEPRSYTGHDPNGSRPFDKLKEEIFGKQESKRLGEKARQATGGMRDLYSIARERFGGDAAASVVAKAVELGLSRAEIFHRMNDEIDAGNVGNSNALAYALLGATGSGDQ